MEGTKSYFDTETNQGDGNQNTTPCNSINDNEATAFVCKVVQTNQESQESRKFKVW